MRGRRVVLAMGVLALALGVAALVAPGTLPVGGNRALVALAGGLALLLAVGAIQARRRGDLEWATTPDVELAAPAARPGDDVGAVLAEFLPPDHDAAPRYRVRAGLRAVATAVLARFHAASTAEAREAVESGTWTGDDHAAAFLGKARSLGQSLRPILRHAIRGETAFERGRRRAIDAIARRAGLSSPSDEGAKADAPAPPGGSVALGDGGERRSTGHWRGTSAVALLGVGVGVLASQPSLVLAGAVGAGYVAFARSTTAPAVDVAVERTVAADRSDPGEEVAVTVSVTNEGDRALPDLRLVDGVPEGLAVAEGSPRLGTALRPGETATVEYAVRARRGVHEFEPALVLARDLASTTERERRVGPATTLTCVPELGSLAEPLALRDGGDRLVGRETAASAGEGVEFHSTREYRPGDPLARIDWNRRARTGQLSTVAFREERAATVLLLIDAREPAYRAPDGGPPHAVDRAVDAAGRLFETLRAGGNRVGIAAAPAPDCWLSPGTDADHAVAARDLLATHSALGPVPRERATLSSRWRRRLRRRLPAGAQVVFLSPLCDDGAAAIARGFEERGHPVTVVSVDPTTAATPDGRLARVTRRLRVSELRRRRVPVVDWDWAEPLAAAVARANERGPP